MAEISSLLGLITDDNTRQALIAQMENMFDNAPDEERLIQEIGNPTKVAVALIRYADSGKVTPAAAPVVAPEQAPKRTPQPRAAQTAPSTPLPDVSDEPAAASVLDGQFSFDDQPESDGYYDEQPAGDDGYYDEQPAGDDGYYDEQPAGDDGYYDEQPAGDDDYYDEQPAGDDDYYDEQPAGDDGYDDPNYATDGEEGYYDEAYYEDEPAYKTNVFLAVLYTLGAIVIGVPVLAVLLVLDLAVLAIGVACGAGGVGLIATAFIGLPMVADMLILLGGGAAVIAIALVVIWLAIWLFIRMVIGWVRLLVRLGKRWCRKEIAA